MRLGVSAALVDGVVVAGDVDVADGLVTAVGLAAGADASGLAAPGFVDLHINGLAGVDFLHADADGYARAGAALAATGVVAYRPTFITAPEADTLAALAVAAGLPCGPGAAAAQRVPGGATILPEVLGVHLEGPFLSPRWPGAHDPADLRAISDDLVDRLLAGGPVTHVTLAPELPGGMDLVARLSAAGILVSLGHTDADAADAHAAFDRGARSVTHLHNAQRRWSARDPGVAGAGLVRPDVVVQLICDGVHLAPETVLGTFNAAPGRTALVTDAIEATGLPPGDYRLGDRDVVVTDADVRRPDGRLAGTVLTMDAAVRHAVSFGVDRVAALEAASAVPARLAGRADLGVLRPGSPANLVVLDDAGEVRRTLIRGETAYAA